MGEYLSKADIERYKKQIMEYQKKSKGSVRNYNRCQKAIMQADEQYGKLPEMVSQNNNAVSDLSQSETMTPSNNFVSDLSQPETVTPNNNFVSDLSQPETTSLPEDVSQPQGKEKPRIAMNSDWTDDMLEKYYEENPKKGYIRLTVTTADSSQALSQVPIVISKTIEGRTHVFATAITDNEGMTELLEVPAMAKELSQFPSDGTEKPCATYDVEASHLGYVLAENYSVSVFEEIVSIQPVQMVLQGL